MNIQNELSLLFNSLFSDELLQTLLQIYQHDMIQQGCEIYERDYQAGIKSLSTILSDEQTKILQAIEQKYKQKMRQFFILSFQKSTCSYFQACFSPAESLDIHPEYAFQMHDMILKQETVQMISQKIHDLTQQLNHEIHTIQREHLSSICVAWEERCYGVFRYAFYLGICFASSLFSQTTTNIEEINRMEVYVAKVKQRFGIV